MRASRWGLVAATLVGLVAMHGLGSHGVHGADSDQAAMTHGVASVEDMLVPMADEVASPMPAHGGLGLEVLCVAILGGLGVVLGLLRRIRSATDPRESGSRSYSLVRPRARDPDPPTLAELSILRC